VAYVPVEPIIVTTVNQSGRTIYDDHCGGGVQGYELLRRWDASFGVSRACLWRDGSGPRSYGVAIPAGASHVDTLHVNSEAYTGTWRVELYLRDANGARLPLGDRVSNTFRVQGRWTPNSHSAG
jgi:hypothetical protein